MWLPAWGKKAREMLPGSGLCARRPVLGCQYLAELWWVSCRSWTLGLCAWVCGWMRAHPQYGHVANSAFRAGAGNGALFVHLWQVWNGVRGWVGPGRLPQPGIALPLHSSAQELTQLQPLALRGF